MASRQDIQKERQQRADEIISKLKPCVADVLTKYPVELAYLHGSVARGRPLPSSDIDIAVLLSALPPPYDQLILEINIQAALEDACHLSNIDVRVINNAPIMVQGTIVQEGILLYSRAKEQRVAFEVLTRKKYFDYLPAFQRMQQAFLDHLRTEGLSRGQSKQRSSNSEQSTRLSE